MSDKVRVYMPANTWHLHLEVERNAVNEQIGEYANQILALQIKCRKLQAKIDEYHKVERGACISENGGMAVRYFSEDESFCYESYDKGEMGFHPKGEVK